MYPLIYFQMKCMFLFLDCLKNEYIPCDPSQKSNKKIYIIVFLFIGLLS